MYTYIHIHVYIYTHDAATEVRQGWDQEASGDRKWKVHVVRKRMRKVAQVNLGKGKKRWPD